MFIVKAGLLQTLLGFRDTNRKETQPIHGKVTVQEGWSHGTSTQCGGLPVLTINERHAPCMLSCLWVPDCLYLLPQLEEGAGWKHQLLPCQPFSTKAKPHRGQIEASFCRLFWPCSWNKRHLGMPADRGGLLLESTGQILGVLSESLKCPCHLLITKALKQSPAHGCYWIFVGLKLPLSMSRSGFGSHLLEKIKSRPWSPPAWCHLQAFMWSVWVLSSPYPASPLCWVPVSQTFRTGAVCLSFAAISFSCPLTSCCLIHALSGVEIPCPCHQMVMISAVSLRWLVFYRRWFSG